MKKRMISVVLVLAMALSMTMAVSAADWESTIDPVGVAVVGNTYYQTVQQAVDNANGELVKLIADPKDEVVTNTATPLYLDLNGFDVEINGGSVYLIDSATDDGEVGGELTGNVTKYQDVTEKGAIDYLVLEKDGVKTANAVRVKLRRVTIRPGTDSAGIYYTTNFVFNENVVTAGATYGVVLSVVDAPDEGFETDDKNEDGVVDNLWTAIDAKADGKFEQNGNSCLCANIFRANDENNATYGATPIYANAYVKVNGATIMAENTDEVKYSIQTIMEAFNTSIENGTLEDSPKANVLKFYEKWQSAMTGWAISKIAEAYTAANPAE